MKKTTRRKFTPEFKAKVATSFLSAAFGKESELSLRSFARQFAKRVSKKLGIPIPAKN